MDLQEAQALHREIVRERGSDFAELRKLGNGDYVIILSVRGQRAYWLFEPADWPRWVSGRTCVACGIRSQFTKMCSRCKHQFCQVDRSMISGQVVCHRCVPIAQIVDLSEARAKKKVEASEAR